MTPLLRLLDPARRVTVLPEPVQAAWWQLADAADDRELLTALAHRPDRTAAIAEAAAAHHRACVRAARPRKHPVAESRRGQWPRTCFSDPGSWGHAGGQWARRVTPKSAAADRVKASAASDLWTFITELYDSSDSDLARALSRRADLPDDALEHVAPYLRRADAASLFRRLRARGPLDVASEAGRGALVLATLLHGVDLAVLGEVFTDGHAAVLALLPPADRFRPRPEGATAVESGAVIRAQNELEAILAQNELEAVVSSGALTPEDIGTLPLGGCLREKPAPRTFQEAVHGALGDLVGDDAAGWASLLALAERQPDMPLEVAAAVSRSPAT